MGDPAQLEYVAARSHRRRRQVVWIIVATAVVFSGYLTLKDAEDPVTLMYRQHRCMSFVQSPEVVVYEEDHAAAAKLAHGARMGPGWTSMFDPASNAILAYYADARPVLQPFYEFGKYGPPLFQAIQDLQPPSIYLHWRRATGGEKRLVYVRVNNFFALRGGITGESSMLAASLPSLDWIVINPATVLSNPSVLQRGSWHDRQFATNLPKPLTIYAGQSDGADDSHFSVRFHTPDGYGMLDGWLLNNDVLNLQATFAPGGGSSTRH